jgi:hypothetical protein
MTTIAWDGKTLAVDRQADNGETRETVTKLRWRYTAEGKEVMAWTGFHEQGLWLAEWYFAGADRSKWPEFQASKDWTILVVAGPKGVKVYERLPIAQKIEDAFMAWGAGRNLALGAMAAGADACQAIEIATRFDIHTGQGVNSIDVY